MQQFLEKHTPPATVPSLDDVQLPGGWQAGTLLLDLGLKVVYVDRAYERFHLLYNNAIPQVGKKVQQSTFTDFPADLHIKLSSLLAGDTECINLQVQDPQEPLSFFQLRLQMMTVDEKNTEGIGLFMQKMEPTTLNAMQPLTAELFEVLVQNSTDVYQLADAGFIISFTSNAVESVLGYLPHQFIGRSVLENIHPDDKENVKEWLIGIRAIKEKLLTLEYRVKNKEGEWVWIENNGRNMLHHPHVKAIVLNFRNIQAKKIADHALIQAEQRLSLLLNNTEESFIIVNSRLRVITYNKAAQVHSPYFFSQELQSGMSVLDLVQKNDVEEYIKVFEDVFTGDEVEKETLFIDKNNNKHIYNHTYRPLFDAHGDISGVFITSTNITERKKLTEELAVNSQRLQTAQQIARLGYFEYNFFTKESFFSRQFYSVLGLKEEEFNWQELSFIQQVVHPDDSDMVREKIETSLANAEDFNIEFRTSLNTEEKVILAIGAMQKDGNNELQKITITIQDITDSKMAILAIQTLESRFRSLFENSIDGVMLSRNEGEIISANPSLCKMLGYTPEEIIQLHRHDLLETEAPAVKEMVDQRKKTGAYMGELMIRHKHGHYIPAEVTSILKKDGEGIEYISSIIRDITEKKKIETEQKALTEELLKNNQDLQQFSFITSHNLRAPVANLISLLSLYNRQNPAEEFNQVLVDKFSEATQQLNQTLNDLVNVLVIKSNNYVEKERLHLTNVLAEVKRNVENLMAEQEGVIEADFSELDEVVYNRIHIESIFLNMISNAIRYRSPERTPNIKIRSYVQPGWVVVEFADNGLGMDLKRYGDRLFGLYQRFHENKEGKGLGLYMTRSQVLAMGGKIEVDSEPGVGTTFKIYIKTV